MIVIVGIICFILGAYVSAKYIVTRFCEADQEAMGIILAKLKKEQSNEFN